MRVLRQSFAVFQERWLRERVGQYRAQRWRAINQVTPFGLLRLPVRVVRRCDDGHYLTLSRLLGSKATRLALSQTAKQVLDLEPARAADLRTAVPSLITSWATARASMPGTLSRHTCAFRLVAGSLRCAPAAEELKRTSNCASTELQTSGP